MKGLIYMKEDQRKEKMCLFFTSDYHFEMISLPYISKNLEDNKEIIMITENNLEQSVEKVLDRINLAEQKKELIKQIDWNNKNLNKFDQLKEEEQEKKDTIIFIKGKENYINNINKNIKNWINLDNVEMIDCYDINDVKEDINLIVKKYDKILSTSGIEKLLK